MIANSTDLHSVSKRLKVAMVCLDDASDPHIISGGPYKIRQAFHDLNCEVIDIFPIRPAVALTFLPKKILYRLMGRYYHWERETLFLKRVARHIEHVLRNTRPDFVYVVQPQACSELVTDIPVVMSHDQTFIERLCYFPYEQRPPCNEYVGQAITQEGKAFRNIDLAIYPSERSIATIRSAYGIADERLAMLPWGGNLAAEPGPGEAEAMIRNRRFGPFTLTFIGVDWKRKGGDIVLEAHRLLRARGLDVRLNLIGVHPPTPVDNAVTVIPFIDKADARDAQRLWSILADTHLLFVPSRVEAYGHVFCEAAAFGVPAVATDVGGIPTIIEDGVNGCLLSAEADARAFADSIFGIFSDEQGYRAMALTSRQRYDTQLNWRTYCSSIIEHVLHRK